MQTAVSADDGEVSVAPVTDQASLPRRPSAGKRLDGQMGFLDQVPKHLKEGPWHPVATGVLVVFAIWVLATSGWAAEAFINAAATAQEQTRAEWHAGLRAALGLYMWGVTASLIYCAGFWALGSYTLTSWNVLATRLLSSALSFYYPSLGGGFFSLVSSLLRFPALVGACITFTVWWTALVPAILFLLRKEGPQKQWDFVRFNFNPFLINLHLLNLPIALADFTMAGLAFTFFDLWAGMLVALTYVLFYLNVLDAAGVHLYIVFTPRTPWALVSYSTVIALYLAVYVLANSSLPGTGAPGGMGLEPALVGGLVKAAAAAAAAAAATGA